MHSPSHQHPLATPPTLVHSAQSWNTSDGHSGSDLDDWIPPAARIVVLGTILPGAIVLAALLFDLLSRIPWPNAVKRIGRGLRSPFIDFLTLKDLNREQIGPALVSPLWKTRTLVLLASLHTVGWAGALAYGLLAGETDHANRDVLRELVGTVAWVSPP